MGNSIDWRRVRSLIRYVLAEAFVLSAIVLVWVASYRLTLDLEMPSVEVGDLMALLFGAASIALFVLSFFVGLLGILGWQTLKSTIAETTDAAISREVDRMSAELSGRLWAGMGYVLGRLARPEGAQVPNRGDLLEDAITRSRKAVETLATLPRAKEHHVAAMNNLAFYLACKGEQGDAAAARQLALHLQSDYGRTGNVGYILTYCKVLLTFPASGDDKKVLRETLLGLVKSTSTSEDQKQEARLYLASCPADEAKKP
jgi:hypothetical protein